jgi:cephalosporin-C deacetylase-like acetyl esterase
MSYMAWEIDESLFGMRVKDVVRSVDYVLSRPDVDRAGVRVIGKGMGALWALFAAALDERISALVADSGLLSYRTLTRVDRYLHDADVFIPDVLNHFDLPQVAAALAGRPLTILCPVDAMMRPVELASARREYDSAAEAYRNVGGRFRVVPLNSDTSRTDQYLEFLHN